jgi:hypothetical protein
VARLQRKVTGNDRRNYMVKNDVIIMISHIHGAFSSEPHRLVGGYQISQSYCFFFFALLFFLYLASFGFSNTVAVLDVSCGWYQPSVLFAALYRF